ncbi:MAG TPA: Asp-tRNA(Asn)/Glu-tRNA(Gln) amidotransferase subunit GatB [Candidatus Micrarchaeaceae archaeon]|nr:Asp-tRNA(Asn)/Glu-tRNA(Gln) amidotransferase subunit GatB [Candidatus Micrarchaeaceae archaeon]
MSGGADLNPPSGPSVHLPGKRGGQPPAWEVVIGMEVHVQPRTRTKMFCGCEVGQPGDLPNSNVCEICAGLPGTLPVINKAAVEACLKTAVALRCEIPRHTKFDRKNYMYPDLPKGYQISQYDLPMSHDGILELDGRKVRIRRVHLEEDTGKLVHAGDKLHMAKESFVDLNRAGIPLMEIVTEPDLRSADEARDYAVALRTLLRTIGASEAEMEKGQLRAEPNISIRRAGTEELGVKTELKNINSFRALHRAIQFEVARQVEVLESGGTVAQETRGWSEAEQRTFSQRSKEFAEDYRYFPEPDLPPLELDPKWIEVLRQALPEMPGARRSRLISEYGLPATDAHLIAAEVAFADLFEATVKAGAQPRATANWIVGEVAPSGKLPTPAVLSEIVKLVTGGSITRDQGREVLHESLSSNRTAAEIVAERGFAQDSDEASVKAIVEAVIAANPRAAEDYRAGKKQALGALIADVKKRAPQTNPKVASDLLMKALSTP